MFHGAKLLNKGLYAKEELIFNVFFLVNYLEYWAKVINFAPAIRGMSVMLFFLSDL
jgi:hypothetical protein